MATENIVPIPMIFISLTFGEITDYGKIVKIVHGWNDTYFWITHDGKKSPIEI